MSSETSRAFFYSPHIVPGLCSRFNLPLFLSHPQFNATFRTLRMFFTIHIYKYIYMYILPNIHNTKVLHSVIRFFYDHIFRITVLLFIQSLLDIWYCPSFYCLFAPFYILLWYWRIRFSGNYMNQRLFLPKHAIELVCILLNAFSTSEPADAICE